MDTKNKKLDPEHLKMYTKKSNIAFYGKRKNGDEERKNGHK